MPKGTGVLESPKGFLEQFARDRSSITNCTCTTGKVSGPSHRMQPNAIVTKTGEYNIDVNVDHVFVGVRYKGQAFSCRLTTTDPHGTKKVLIEYLKHVR